MSNALITSSMITNETLRILHNRSAFLGNIDRQYDDQFAQKGAKAGSTINIRRPVQFTVRSGAVVNLQDVNETTTPLTMQPEFGIDWTFSDHDLALSIDEFSDRYLKPAGTRLASELDYRISSAIYKQVWNFSGTPGTTPSTAQAWLDAATVLDNNTAPRDGERYAALSPNANGKLVGGMAGLFHATDRNTQQVKSGMMNSNLGFDFGMSQNLPTHTVGPLGGVPVVAGANQGLINSGATDNPYGSTTSLTTSGWTAAAAQRLAAGDVITLANVFAVNAETRQSTGELQQFVVTANVSSDGAGLATVIVSPAIIAGGSYQNVTVRPANLAAITVVTGTANTGYQQNMIWHRSAITLATVDMELPKGTDMAARSVYEGVSLRFIRDYDITNNRRICRFDILAGFTAQRPEWIARVTS